MDLHHRGDPSRTRVYRQMARRDRFFIAWFKLVVEKFSSPLHFSVGGCLLAGFRLPHSIICWLLVLSSVDEIHATHLAIQATSPSRWNVKQCFCRGAVNWTTCRRSSLVRGCNVGEGVIAGFVVYVWALGAFTIAQRGYWSHQSTVVDGTVNNRASRRENDMIKADLGEGVGNTKAAWQGYRVTNGFSARRVFKEPELRQVAGLR